MIKISFIIPAYNCSEYIEKCVVSILNQTITDYEIIIVNDGSTDNTLEIIELLACCDNRIKIIDRSNSGVSISRNVGLDNALGEFVVFVDADDYLSPNYAEYMCDLIKNSEFAFSVNCYTSKNDCQLLEDRRWSLNSSEATAILLSPILIVGCWNKIYRRDFLNENNIRFLPELFYGEGLEFITHVSQKARRITVGEKRVYYYRRNNYASATSKFSVDKFYNGSKSIDIISSRLEIRTPDVLDTLRWHKCQFKMGIVINLIGRELKTEDQNFYKESLVYLRKNCISCLRVKKVSLYKKMLILGTAIAPRLMSWLDRQRRKIIAINSV